MLRKCCCIRTYSVTQFENTFNGLHTCALSHVYPHPHMILLPHLNTVPVGIDIFALNAMGDTHKGQTVVRKHFIKGKCNQDSYPFCIQLSGGHRPLSAEVKNSNAMSWTMSPGEVAGRVKGVKELEDENIKLKEEVARYAERVKELEDENKKLKKKVDRLPSKFKSEHK